MDGDRHRAALVAPTLSRARGVAAALERRASADLSPFSLAGYLASSRAPRQVILCPSGRSVAEDVAFLRRVRDRVLWEAPDDVLYDAIAGLLGPPIGSPDRSPLIRPRRRRPGPGKGEKEALLLEGIVDRDRARTLLGKSARLWIVERPGRVRLDRPMMDRLRQSGVRWRALEPVAVIAVLASPPLARARSRWKHLVPSGTPIWNAGRP